MLKLLAADLLIPFQKQAQMLHDIRGNANLSHKAHWEAKTGKMIEKNIVRNRIEDMRRRQA